MSILVVQLVPEGILFGADRNITAQLRMRDGSEEIIVTGQTERPKVLKWPNHELIVGYVGTAQLQGRPADRWLYAFIGRHLTFTSLGSVADALNRELDSLFRAGDFDGPMIVHIGGFERINGQWTPRVYFIRNTTELRPDGRYVVGDGFTCTEELSQPVYYGARSGDEIRDALRREVHIFQQGYDLGSFGLFREAVWEVMGAIIHTHPLTPHPAPTTLDQWEKHVALAIRVYGAYFAAFYPPFQQYVGGGADVVYAEWPT